MSTLTREEMVKMAREAGGFVYGPVTTSVLGSVIDVMLTPETLERFAALVAAHEREACAKVAEESDDLIAYAIRARGDLEKGGA